MGRRERDARCLGRCRVTRRQGTVVERAWNRLAGARRLRIVVSDGEDRHAAQWVGAGHVWTEAPDERTIVTVEEGVWLASPVKTMRTFRGAYRWRLTTTAGGPRLEVAQVRRGLTAAVRLGYLLPVGPDTLASSAPHVCGADRYAPAAAVGAEDLLMTWDVEGPGKRQRITARYS